jgi:hypothetical protein
MPGSSKRSCKINHGPNFFQGNRRDQTPTEYTLTTGKGVRNREKSGQGIYPISCPRHAAMNISQEWILATGNCVEDQ